MVETPAEAFAVLGNDIRIDVLLALDESAVIEFFERHDVDLSDRPYWDCSLCMDPEHLTVDSRDPWRVELSVTRGDETLCMTFDSEAEIREVAIDP